ncbi:aldose 1-epimerase family protein [Flagellimonas sp. HMM57]|uniref:aldose 1-epimerase family protein n=1 Tax=unclassified Flagellimonas TaxID=2644544 RepID=UPI0013D63AAF|nr:MULTISPECIES: aldose 1-epimerase family protein [unclassified Flagellimonas]UII77671.1 aldose 1-epimerase family protein [Flagellimonas sp. HMM57]
MKNLFPVILIVLLFGCQNIAKDGQTVILKNEYIKVEAKKTGAELISIKLLEDDIEYLWQGDSLTWSDHAIVQFPIIGNLKNDQYRYNGKQYGMMSHGFARISDFEVVEKSNEKVIFQLKSSSSTQKIYPFDFVFRVSYILKEDSIFVIFDVENTGNDIMYFSLGYHPGFNWPIGQDETMGDHYLEFSHSESVDRLVMNENLIDSLQRNFLSGTKKIELDKDLFQDDVVILAGIKSESLGLKNTKNQRSVTVTFGEVPYLGIWSPKKNGDFVCIEPWFGVPDWNNASGELEKKEGIIDLVPSDHYQWECKITIQ